VQVPEGQYSVSVLDKVSGQFLAAESDLLCTDVLLDGNPRLLIGSQEDIINVRNCEIFTPVTIQPNEIQYLRVVPE